jgi:hypothetical protein
MHAGRISRNQKSQITKDVSDSDVLIFEGTHLVLPVTNLIKSDLGKRVIVVSHDLLKAREENLNLELRELQLSALRKGEAFSVNSVEAEYFSSFGINCHYSPLPTRSLRERNILGLNNGNFTRHLVNDSEKLVLFVGSSYGPNLEALQFIRKVSKKFALSNPEIKFVVVGSVSEPNQEQNLICLGRVSILLLEELYFRSNLVISPIFSGQGSPSKTIEALSRGCKVLSTITGARGLNHEDHPNLFILESDGEGEKQFVNKMLQLLDFENQFEFNVGQILAHPVESVFSSLLPIKINHINSKRDRLQDDLLIDAINDQEFLAKCIWTEDLLKNLEASSTTIKQRILFGYLSSMIETNGDFMSFIKSEKLILSPALFRILNQCKDSLSYEAAQKFASQYSHLQKEIFQTFTPNDLGHSELEQNVFLGEFAFALYSRIRSTKYFKHSFSDKSINSLSNEKANIRATTKRWILSNSYLKLRPTFFWMRLFEVFTKKT